MEESDERAAVFHATLNYLSMENGNAQRVSGVWPIFCGEIITETMSSAALTKVIRRDSRNHQCIYDRFDNARIAYVQSLCLPPS